MISTPVSTSMNVTRVSTRVSTYVLIHPAHLTAGVDQATESSTESIVRILTNVWKPTTARKPAPTLLVVTNVPLNKNILRLVSELNTILDIFKLYKVTSN